MTAIAGRADLDHDALLKLTAWLSPSYPVGAYTYSHGLEFAVEAGDVDDRASLTDWIGACVRVGAGRSDAILLAHAWRAVAAGDAEQLATIAALATALAPASERWLETTAQGTAFVRVSAAVWPAGIELPHEVAYPVAVGAFAAAHGCPVLPTTTLYLQAFVANIVSAGVRLVPLGQTDGQRTLAALFPEIRATAAAALTAGLDDLGGCALRSDLAAIHHETQYTRLFRS